MNFRNIRLFVIFACLFGALHSGSPVDASSDKSNKSLSTAGRTLIKGLGVPLIVSGASLVPSSGISPGWAFGLSFSVYTVSSVGTALMFAPLTRGLRDNETLERLETRIYRIPSVITCAVVLGYIAHGLLGQ